MPPQPSPLPWLASGQAFPAVDLTWGKDTPAPGLLAAGGCLDVETLRRAYTMGIFPWFSEGQPILWWSPSPRMVLEVAQFKLHRSLKKKIQKFRADKACEIRIDYAFAQVIEACSCSPRDGQAGTWIVADMIDAYTKLHEAGLAHSVETWINGQLEGGLYCVSLGRYVFGESMFSRSTDSSKIALAALVAYCRYHGISNIDCQQNTNHLSSLGAREVARHEFIRQMKNDISLSPPDWKFDALYWAQLLPGSP